MEWLEPQVEPEETNTQYVGALIDVMAKGDQLWKFRSPEETWWELCGREGIALVRKGKIIGAIVTVTS